MDSDTFFADVDAESPAYLLLTRPSGERSAFVLDENNSFFAGEGASCRMLLDGPGVEPIHCMFWVNASDRLCVQDWNTSGKTLRNGSPVETEIELDSGDEIKIGQHLIVPVLNRECHRRAIDELADTFERQSDIAGSKNTEGAAAERISAPVTEDCSSAVPEKSASKKPKEVAMAFAPESKTEPLDGSVSIADSNEAIFSSSGFQYDVDADLKDESEGAFPAELPGFDEPDSLGNDLSFADLSFADPSLDDEESGELAMLRMEIEQLQFELSQRNSQSTEGSQRVGDDAVHAADPEQTVRLVNRLEELLEELQASDERIQGLEELLQVSDQATQAEREERLQLENWVTEIEQRIGQREEESQAELDRFASRFEAERVQRKQVESQLKKIVESRDGAGGGVSQEVLSDMANQLEQLKSRVEETNQENERLRQMTPETSEEAHSPQAFKALEQQLLDAQIASSKERAELARQRADLERTRDEFESKLKSGEDFGNADSKVRAMRQHLREIHEQEKRELSEKKQRSLSGRISSLLNRVGR